MMRRVLPLALLVLLVGTSSFADTKAQSDLRKMVRIDQKLDAQIPLDLEFRDSNGKKVQLRQLIKGDRPVLLNLVYFSCPMLCNIVLDGLVNTMADLKFDVGREFDVITVSFDHRDTAVIAQQKKDLYVKRYARPGTAKGWHFLTGDEATIRRLTDSVGFKFQWDPQIKQYAHGAALIVLTPEGKASRYLYGFEHKTRDLRLALVEASESKIGSMSDQFLLVCYHYDPATGKYSAQAVNLVRAGGAATVLALAGFIIVMVRRDRLHERITRRDQ